MNSNALPIKQGTEPLEGRKSWTSNWDFTQSQTYTRTLILTDVGMPSGIQGCFIDNSNSPAPLVLATQGSNQKVVCPAYSQGYFPVLNVGSNFQFTASSAGAVNVPFILFNFEVDFAIINSQGQTIAGTVAVSGIVGITSTVAAFTDRSGLVAAAATSQQLVAANGLRKRMLIANPGGTNGQFAAGQAGRANGTLESLYINFTAPAGVDDGLSLELLPGGVFDTGIGPCTSELINVTAPTAGHRYIAKEM